MWFGKAVTASAMAVLICNGAVGSAIECPRIINGKHLTDVGVYDGPVSEMADLIGLNGEWKLDYPSASKKGFYLGCRYRDKVLELPLPAAVRRCWFASYGRVLCR